MTGKPTNEARLIRLEEQVKTLFVTVGEVKAGVDKILNKLENGKIHQFRLDDQDENLRELQRKVSDLQAFQDTLKGKLAMVGIAFTVAAALVAALVTAALQYLATT
jgi:ethanolamine utilization microcompartment shell protein EutL